MQNTTLPQEQVLEITLSIHGGLSLGDSAVTVKPDVVICTRKIRYPEQKTEVKEIPFARADWDVLLKKLDLDILEKIKSGPTRQAADEQDEDFTILTNKRKISFSNGLRDENYNKMENFIYAVHALLHREHCC